MHHTYVIYFFLMTNLLKDTLFLKHWQTLISIVNGMFNIWYKFDKSSNLWWCPKKQTKHVRSNFKYNWFYHTGRKYIVDQNMEVLKGTILPLAFALVSCSAYFFDSEDGGDMFLQNVGCHLTDYKALYPRRLYSSQPPLWEPQILQMEVPFEIFNYRK
jgi:hypothetical protein